MNLINVDIIPTSDLNAVNLEISFVDFDPHTGIQFLCTFFNLNRMIIDRKLIQLDGDDWQKWPEFNFEEQDYDYVKNVILRKLNIIDSKKTSK